MKMIQIREAHEHDIALRWWSLRLKSLLPLSNGGQYRLLSAGRPGGSMGPDVRDATLCIAPFEHNDLHTSSRCSSACKLGGDIEFHIRSSDWKAHQHQVDSRYNQVILHVVLLCDDPQPTMRQDGQVVPTCSLYDLPSAPISNQTIWRCHRIIPELSSTERYRLLRHAGLLRFEQKTYAFVAQLRDIHASLPSLAEVHHSVDEKYDHYLIPALAEGLGYGRDRKFFRLAGLYLSGQASVLPILPGRSPYLSSLDAGRLRTLWKLIEQRRTPGLWHIFKDLLLSHPKNSLHRVQTLRTIFSELGLSLARTDILICNVVLPFAAAIAFLEHNTFLAEQAQEVYLKHPGLSSNRITRMMCVQLQLQEEPRNSCQQQGLHYIYQQTCREKHCETCIAGKYDL